MRVWVAPRSDSSHGCDVTVDASLVMPGAVNGGRRFDNPFALVTHVDLDAVVGHDRDPTRLLQHLWLETVLVHELISGSYWRTL